MTEEFHRIRRLPPYVFASVNQAKAAARARGEDIIDLVVDATKISTFRCLNSLCSS
ncbi:hypothetical protein JK182_16510, partial [Acetobacter okinawensis]|nr:hypothetical protein [Acetobacter okinawensis]